MRPYAGALRRGYALPLEYEFQGILEERCMGTRLAVLQTELSNCHSVGSQAGKLLSNFSMNSHPPKKGYYGSDDVMGQTIDIMEAYCEV